MDASFKWLSIIVHILPVTIAIGEEEQTQL